MTYPQQGYQPQQPPYGQPPMQTYTQQVPPAYQPQAPYMPPAQTPVAASWTPPQFTEPGGGGEGGSPLKIREIEGRICGVQPVRYIEETYDQNGKVKETAKVVVDILVLDGSTPLEYGASNGYQDNPPGPPVYAVDSLPVLIKGVVTGNWQIVKKVKEVLDTAPRNTIPCRIVRGTKGQNPYFLAEINGDLDPGTTPEQGAQLRGMLGAAYAAVGTGRWPDGSPYVAPVPREINGGPRQKPNQANAQAAPAAQVATYPPQAAYPPPAPVGQVVYPQATGAVQQQFAPGSREAYLSGQEAPAGWDLATWQTKVAPADRAQFLPQQ